MDSRELAAGGPLSPLHNQQLGTGTREFRPAPAPDVVHALHPHPVQRAGVEPTPPAEPEVRGPAVPADPETGLVCFNGLELDPATGAVRVDGAAVELTGPEFDLLAALLHHGERVQSKAALVLVIRGHRHTTAYDVTDTHKRALDAEVESLCRKLGEDPEAPRFVVAVPGVGYRLADRS